MIETLMIKRHSTKQLISALESLQILSVFGFKETEGYVEVLFRINEESKTTWISVIDRLIGIHDNITVNKRYLIKDGKPAFAWAIGVVSDFIDKDVEQVITAIQQNISRVSQTNKPEPTKQLSKKLFGKKHFNKPIYADPESGVVIWEVALSNVDSERNKPRQLEDGTLSTKGAFTLSDKGKKEWSKAVSSFHRRGTIR